MNTASIPAAHRNAVHVSRQVQRQIARLQAKQHHVTPAEAARRRLAAAKEAKRIEAARKATEAALEREAKNRALKETYGLEPVPE